jgi:protein-tyrosine sulfotransferase
LTEKLSGDPIFIQGILARSGTNFLRDLLCQHPDCIPSRPPISEDLFLDKSNHLVDFIVDVRRWWDPSWGEFDDALVDDFYRSLGEGLLAFIWKDRTHRLVTKTPSVRHLDRFFRFFPTGRLLIIVRDGRSVAQSANEIFGWSLEEGAHRWAQGARDIRRFEETETAHADRFAVVRYEDLVTDLPRAFRPILEFLELDPERYDFERGARTPVRGSSFYRGDRPLVHWDPVVRGGGFDPLERWREFPSRVLERVEWIAGPELEAFGYQRRTSPHPAFGRRVQLQALELAWRTGNASRRARQRTRARIGAWSWPLRQRVRDLVSRR